ncbi:MAG: hypothetical protein PHH60_01805 [Candidatus Margulisbacteria bacterium]|nr:hypothetical protein [Candidatus Margulisiibacteriota bacterium]
MLRKALISIGLLGIGIVACASIFYPIYPVLGGAVSSVSGISVENRMVVLYDPDSQGEVAKLYGYAYISSGKFVVNAFKANPVTAGKSYKIAISRGADNYGSNPLDVTITGHGFEQLPANLVLAYGVGPKEPTLPGTEPRPQIKLWFGNRLYQPGVYTKATPFVVTETPNIQAKISIPAPFSVSNQITDYSIMVDPDSSKAKTLALSSSNMTAQAMAAGELKGFTLEYAMKEEEKLESGEHTFQVRAMSSGTQGGSPTSTTYLATVEVIGGPLRLIGTPITFPSPYSISKHKTVTIQYGLSANANIEIYIIGVGGQRIKHYVINAGGEGGSAGVNKLIWDGRTDQGYLAGNAIYVGTIVARDENRLLGKFKLTVVD